MHKAVSAIFPFRDDHFLEVGNIHFDRLPLFTFIGEHILLCRNIRTHIIDAQLGKKALKQYAYSKGSDERA